MVTYSKHCKQHLTNPSRLFFLNNVNILLSLNKFPVFWDFQGNLVFATLAILRRFNKSLCPLKEQWKEQSNEDLEPPPEHTPPPPRPPKRTLEMNNGKVHEHPEFFPKHHVIEEEIKCAISSNEEKVPDGRACAAEPLDTER